MLPDELAALDAVAETVEIMRLQKLGVLLNPECLGHLPHDQVKRLSTRMVYDWRAKQVEGAKVWLRRARYVAREYAWLSERSDTFAPASSSMLHRLLPILFATSDRPGRCLVAIDISDAFVTVDQVTPTLVTHRAPDGTETVYALGKVLPGQQDGSERWYTDFTKFLESQLGIEACEAYPTLLRSPNLESVLQVHVDDVLAFTDTVYAEKVLKPALLSKYKIKFEMLCDPGDCIEFLKRKLHLIGPDQLLITPHPKYLERLCELLQIRTQAIKKTPMLADLEKLDPTPVLDPVSTKVYRSAVGILLYLAHDLAECQCTINMLASKMSCPTQMSMKGLRHLVLYMQGTCNEGIMLSKKEHGVGLIGEQHGVAPLLESFSDANWASNQVTRKSISSGVLAVNGNVLSTSSRSQRVIALSSGESELLASASVVCDAMLARVCLGFCYGMQTLPSVFHHVDSTAALGALRRQGVGKIRHLSTRILWQQSLTKSQVLITLKVPTAVNVADLGTKGLSRSRTLMLKFMLSVYDAEAGAYVGEGEYADHIQRDAARMAVRRIKQSGGSGVSKQMIRQIVIATLCIEHAAAACESDVLGPCHGTTRMSLMVFVVTAVAVACSLQGCYSREQFASLWIAINVPQILLSAIFLLINRLLGIVLDTDAFTCLVQRVTSIAQPESEPTSPSGSMPSLETVSSEEEDIADAHDENGSEHSQEPAALRAFEPEPLDGDFEGVETEPAMLAGDIEDIVIPDDQNGAASRRALASVPTIRRWNGVVCSTN